VRHPGSPPVALEGRALVDGGGGRGAGEAAVAGGPVIAVDVIWTFPVDDRAIALDTMMRAVMTARLLHDQQLRCPPSAAAAVGHATWATGAASTR
jgi:hypothetical protein